MLLLLLLLSVLVLVASSSRQPHTREPPLCSAGPEWARVSVSGRWPKRVIPMEAGPSFRRRRCILYVGVLRFSCGWLVG